MQIFAKAEIRPPIAAPSAHTGNLRIYKHTGLIVLCMQTFAVLSKSFETSFGSCMEGKTVCTVLMSFESLFCMRTFFLQQRLKSLRQAFL